MYQRDHVIPEPGTSPHQILEVAAMQIEFGRNDSVVGWDICSHPEGRVYLRRHCGNVLTNTPLWKDDEDLACAELAIKQIRAMLKSFSNTPTDTVIVLDVRQQNGAVFYYCVSWSNRCIFWPEKTDISRTSNYNRAVYDPSHLAQANQALFWQHAEIFPSHGVKYNIVHELKEYLNYQYLDSFTADLTLVSHESQKIANMMRVVDNLHKDTSDEHLVWVSARLMYSIWFERFMNYHGQLGARLNSTDPIHKQSNMNRRSLFFWLISPALFWLPGVYLREVEDFWLDETVRFIHWNKFITGLKEDWDRYTTPATVLLTANVSFLAIQSIDTENSHRSVAQITSYVSTLLSMTNYIICQILLRQHRRVHRDSAEHAREYLTRQQKNKFGLEIMVIVFSLPYCLFVWSMLTFLASVCWMVFWQTSVITKAVVGAFLGFLGSLVGLVIYLDWRPSSDYETFYQRVVEPLWERLESVVLRPVGRQFHPLPTFLAMFPLQRRKEDGALLGSGSAERLTAEPEELLTTDSSESPRGVVTGTNEDVAEPPVVPVRPPLHTVTSKDRREPPVGAVKKLLRHSRIQRAFKRKVSKNSDLNATFDLSTSLSPPPSSPNLPIDSAPFRMPEVAHLQSPKAIPSDRVLVAHS
ncbi:hypothetical protein BXZ70DRAFT_110522 [Cristinia sonorae]|uniref:Uncharacterized protein n=1 Tax=Cristinia sonorae TaxID=1940300 RepID=A0A8K0UQC4_9AGAR|nr:hypothetical protein BXZ70DRAFT_110522 [Cristinia sonorae]